MSKAKILIVEDESPIRLYLKNSLEDLGYTVVDVALSGEDAIKKAGELHPDLILMDIILDGDIDGITASMEIHNRSDIPVIYLTSHIDDELLQRAKITEPYGYLLKPFDIKELQTAIEISLYKHSKDRELKIEREIAQRTFLSLLPANLPSINGLALFPLLNFSRNFSGDFYDVIPISDTEIAIFVADVVGHGLSSAFVVSIIKAGVSIAKSDVNNPAKFLENLNQFLISSFNDEQFATALLALIDTQKMILRFSSAGHPAPLIIREKNIYSTESNVGLCNEKKLRSFPLGVFPNVLYAETQVYMEKGDKVLLYTDGAVEAKNANKEEFGIARLYRSCVEAMKYTTNDMTMYPQPNPKSTLEFIVSNIANFTESDLFKDDVLLIMIDFL